MSNILRDINDDEIRIISYSSEINYESGNMSDGPDNNEKKRKKRKLIIWLIISLLIIIALIICLIFFNTPESEGPDNIIFTETPATDEDPLVEPITSDSIILQKAYVELTDTSVNRVPLTIFTPRHSVPRLHIGADALRDTNAVFVVQAADIRRDNGDIVGAYVLEGELLSRGQSKSGFCAIINGKPIIGVADSTPYLEQAIDANGYFFRQYPLVVGGQVVDNKLKLSSLRKALAELNGEIVVVMSHDKMTLNDFSQTLVDLGVTNAIYLIGSAAYGFALDDAGNRIEFGIEQNTPSKNINYIIWE